MKRTYRLELMNDGEPVTVDLRLTVGGQFNLKKKFNESALSTIFGSMDDISRMIAVFNETLNFKGNENTIKDGSELYELIVDNDMGGVQGFQQILSGIARESGLLTEKEKNAIDSQAEKVFDESEIGNEKNVEFPSLSKM